MEVKVGYKRTEIGWIPNAWEVLPLRKISPKQSVGLVINPSSYFEPNGPVPFLLGSNILENKINWSDAKRITEKSNQLLSASRLNADDLVMVRVGDPGTTSVIPKELDLCNCGSMMIIRKSNSFNSKWLSYTLNAPICRKQVENVQYGTAQKQFNICDAVNFLLPVPPLPEQQAIAKALSDADALIESLEQLIEKKRQIKQGVMQELLTGKRRLPGFEKEEGFKQTEVGLMPKDWRVESVGAISEVGRGRVISHKEIEKSNSAIYPVYSSQTSNGGVMGFLDTYMFDGDYVTWTTDGANAGTVFARCGKFNCTNVCGTIRLAKDSHIFVAAILNIYAKPHVSRHLGNPKLMNDPMKKVRIPLPSDFLEQKAIADLLLENEALLDKSYCHLNKQREIKQAMMQELLTGKVRLV